MFFPSLLVQKSSQKMRTTWSSQVWMLMTFRSSNMALNFRPIATFDNRRICCSFYWWLNDMVFYSTVLIFTSGPKQSGKDCNKLIMLQHSIHHIQSYTYSQLRWGSGYLYTYMVGGFKHYFYVPFIKKGMSSFPTDFHSIIFQRGRSTSN